VALMPIVARLVVPAHLAKMHAKALEAAGADEVVFDLEDAVAPDGKAAAREQLAATLGEAAWRERVVAVRVNAVDSPEHEHDLALCAALGLERLTIVVPKVEAVGDLEAAAAIAPVQALIETPKGLASAAAIAAHARVAALILGYADLAAALGRRGAERDDARWLVAQETVLAAARIGGAAAVDGPSFALRDQQLVAASARAARELGYDGKWAIHPAQLEPIQAAFAATAEERRWARRVKEAVASAGASGGAAAALDGAMVDEAMVRRADRLLALPESEPPALAGVDGGARVTRTVAAPYFDELEVGATFGAPAVTLTEGQAALHQAIVGDRLRLALDAALYAAVTGTPGLLAHPMLVCDVAIGQSTAPSMRVLGNLFYRGLGARPVPLGTTLKTTTEVVARRAASRGRGIVALHVRTVDGEGVPVLDFHRAPLLPARPGTEAASGADDLDTVGHGVDAAALVPAHWELGPLRADALGPLFADLRAGDVIAVEAHETVTAATELARLSLNMAHTHTDASQGAHGQRLVYGGHVIGVAAGHVTRAFPDLATILAWESCDHLGPTFEGDRLASYLELTACEPLDDGGLVHLRVHTTASADDQPPRDVLDWRLIGLMP
jgi:citrate lyase beta subunit/acyl dehydratase